MVRGWLPDTLREAGVAVSARGKSMMPARLSIYAYCLRKAAASGRHPPSKAREDDVCGMTLRQHLEPPGRSNLLSPPFLPQRPLPNTTRMQLTAFPYTILIVHLAISTLFSANSVEANSCCLMPCDRSLHPGCKPAW